MRSLALPLRAALLSASVIGLAVLSAPAARAQTQIYTSLTDFLGDVQPNYYTETFNTGSITSAASYSYLTNGYGYTVTANTGNVYRSGTDLQTFNTAQDLIFTFTTGNVTAIGGNFYNTNLAGNFVSAAVTITLNDGTSRTYTPGTVNAFRGVTTNIPITSLTLSPTGNRYASVDNLVVGARISPTAAPEPGTVALIAVGALPLAGVVARRRKRA